MERLSNNVSTVIQLQKPINPRTPEDGDNTFSETLVQTNATRYKVQKTSLIDTAVKASQKTVFFNH
jgi:hypothetical protein